MEIIFNTPSAPKETETEENKQNFHIVTPGEQITSDPAFMRLIYKLHNNYIIIICYVNIIFIKLIISIINNIFV